jgi:antitoxin PrlF
MFMATLSVTARGQVTFRKDVLKHLGIEPGDKIEVDKLPDGSLSLHAVRPTGTLDDLFGILKGKSKRKTPMSIEEMNQVIADGWAGRL